MSLRRHVFAARIAFHDWLWQGAADGKPVRKWAAPRLPMYLADPYYIAPEKFDRLMREGEPVEVISRPYSPWVITAQPQTWSTGTASTFTFKEN